MFPLTFVITLSLFQGNFSATLSSFSSSSIIFYDDPKPFGYFITFFFTKNTLLLYIARNVKFIC